jgi:RNA polymerase sigma factor (sigma-70 family)
VGIPPAWYFGRERAVEPIQILLDLIERNRSWLAVQPRFEANWGHGCRWALAEMESWVRAVESDLFPTPVEGERLDRCRTRIWIAWSYHWHEATLVAPNRRADGASVAALLRRGVRPGRVNSSLGGDPIRDSVLVEACLLGHATAHEQLRDAYADVFLREAQRVGAASGGDLLDEVWDRLDPIDAASRGWLERYCGYSSLRTFLRVVVRHRLLDSLRSRCTRRLAERAFTERWYARVEATPTAGAELDEFRTQVRRALLSLPEIEQRLLVLRYLEGLSNGVVAREIGLSDGQTSRLHGQAVARLREALKPLWQEEISSSEQGYSLYAQFLIRGLSETLALQDYRGAAKIAAGPKEGPMALIRETEKRKERQSAPRGGPVSPGRKAPARGEELPAPVPIDLDGLIPETIAVVGLDKKAPEDAFAELRDTPVEKRPGTLCLDARNGSAKDARTWLDRFDALVYEQEKGAVPDPVEMQVVVFLAGKQSLAPFEDVIARSDIDWVLTEDRSSPLTRLYPEVVRKDLSALLSTDPAEGLHLEEDPADPDFRPIEEFLPEDEREEWRQQLRELGHKED